MEDLKHFVSASKSQFYQRNLSFYEPIHRFITSISGSDQRPAKLRLESASKNGVRKNYFGGASNAAEAAALLEHFGGDPRAVAR